MASVKPPRPAEEGGHTARTRTTRVYETKSSSYQCDDDHNHYRSSITPRRIIIQRSSSPSATSRATPVMWGRSKSVCMERGQLFANLAPQVFTTVANTGMTEVKTSREKEKKDMQDLNERFASYIEKVRFLEAQNRRLASELENLKNKWGRETMQVKAMYEAELDEARKCLDDSDKTKSKLEIKVTTLEEQLDELRNRLKDVGKAWSEERERSNEYCDLLKECESELAVMKRRIEFFEKDKAKDKKLIATLQEALNRARMDLDNETLLRIDAENRKMTLEEEIEFLKAVHEEELRELSTLIYRDTTVEHREFWKNEMGNALREIQQVYDEKIDAVRNELESFYHVKIQKMQTDTTRQNVNAARSKEESTRFKTQVTDLRNKIGDLEALNAALKRELDELKRDSESKEQELEGECMKYKTEVARLRAELESILVELQGVLDTKLSLELEISTYRKLLEGEENRVGLLKTIDHYTRYSTEESRMSHRESSGGALSPYDGAFDSHTRHSSGSSGVVLTAGQDTTMTRVTQVVKGEMSAKTINSRSARGHLVIADSRPDGTSLTIENTGKKDENLEGWRVRRTVDNVEKSDFLFPPALTLPAYTKLKIWAKGLKPADISNASDLEYNSESWGVGHLISTKLINAKHEERASHVQKTIQLAAEPPQTNGEAAFIPITVTNTG